ncbi:MAG: 2-C-methyl-D-erythritol 4-phosphate cytidylyltransferase [Syntrophobacteraceae bacterium]
MSRTCAIVPAAGSGVRMGGNRPKQFLQLAGRPILAHTLSLLSGLSIISSIFLIVPEKHIATAGQIIRDWTRSSPANHAGISIVAGGAERQDSVYNGLRNLPRDCGWVLIHDGVRPFASPELVTAAWEGAQQTGASITAIPATDTVKRASQGVVRETLPRDEIWLVQTPQVFRKDIIVSAYDKAMEAGWKGTDDASFVERIGVSVSVVPGERSNIKVTNPEDLAWAEWFLLRNRKGNA